MQLCNLNVKMHHTCLVLNTVSKISAFGNKTPITNELTLFICFFILALFDVLILVLFHDFIFVLFKILILVLFDVLILVLFVLENP